MTDQNSESVKVVGDEEQPSSTNSNTPAHNSSSASQGQDNFGERIKRIEKMVETIQSDKDKGVNKALNGVDELRKSFSEVQSLMKKGLSEDEAFEQLEGRKADSEFKQAVLELRDALKGGKSLPVQANGAQAVPSVVEVLKQYPELDANDTDVVSKILSLTDPKEAEYQALKLIRSRATQTTPSASAASPLSGTPPKPTNEAEKIARLAELQKTPSKFKAEIAKLETELGWK